MNNGYGADLGRPGVSQAPLRSKHAVDTVQAQIGNRALMEYVGRQYEQRVHHVAPGSNPETEPVQMMWPRLARRGLPALMNKSAVNRDRASQVQQASGRNLSTSSRRNIWDKDILFGVEHPDTLELAIRLEASTDSIIPRHMFGYFNKRAPCGFSDGHLWAKSGYGFANRNKLERTDLPYMDYAREAITTAMERGGNIFWALGHLGFDDVFF